MTPTPLSRYLRYLSRMHWLMLVPIMVALAVGVFFIYSSCYVSDETPVKTYYLKQLAWIGVGFAAYFICAFYDDRRLGERWAWPIYLLALLLLILVFIIGRRIYGAQRWIMLPGTHIGLQPSEIAKLATLILMAHLLSLPDIGLPRLKTFVALMLVVLVPLMLVLKQPDLGTSIVFMPPCLVMMFVAGVPLRYLLSIVGTGLLAATLLIGAVVLPDKIGLPEPQRELIQKLVPLTEYQQERIMVMFWPDRDPLGSGWNKNQSLIAVGSGHVWGKGFLKGTQNILGFLPRSVAPTDFIYSVIAEEKGFAGSVFVIVLYGLMSLFGMQVAAVTPDRMGRFLCVGVVAMLFCHVWINIAMTVGLVPITGLPLPLLSYGGSFLVTTLAALGLIQSVYIRSPKRLFSWRA